jgi:CubicO group peptidase (beta-lactamase class C family)
MCQDIGPIDCAKRVLATTPHIAPPGTIWTYSADHLRIAVAVLSAATGKHFGALLHEHVFSRTVPPMTDTRPYKSFKYWNPASNTASTSRDIQRFMDAYFRGLLLSNESAREMEADQQTDTKVRYFMGYATRGRPKDHGLFGLGWWRSHSEHTQCGVHEWCIFGPSHFKSLTAIERPWDEYLGKKVCHWEHSKSCSFYFHFQNTDLLDAAAAEIRFKDLSHIIERHARRVLIGVRRRRSRRRHHLVA